MKLLYCYRCADVFNLKSEYDKTCSCGMSGGKYKNDNEAEYWGECIPFAIDNYSFHARIRGEESTKDIYDAMHGKDKVHCWILKEGSPNFETIKKVDGKPRIVYCVHSRAMRSAYNNSVMGVTHKHLEWLAGGAGISSMVIFFTMFDAKDSLTHLATPSDPSDFGRCYRLLELFPEWKSRLYKLRAVSVKWGTFVDNYAAMEKLWVEERSNATAPKLYKFMKELGF